MPGFLFASAIARRRTNSFIGSALQDGAAGDGHCGLGNPVVAKVDSDPYFVSQVLLASLSSGRDAALAFRQAG